MNYYDGEWRPVTDLSFKALEKLRSRGFELGSDRYGKLMARWPVAPTAPLTSCRACHIEFGDINGHALCDSCLVDRVNGAGELELDDPDDVINHPPLTLPSGVSIRHSHGRYIASDGNRFGGWAETEAGALAKWHICASRGADYDKTVAGLKGG